MKNLKEYDTNKEDQQKVYKQLINMVQQGLITFYIEACDLMVNKFNTH